MSQIDLNNPPPNHSYKLSVERAETEGERRLRLFKDTTLFVVALGLLVALAALCLLTLTGTASADEKKWAMSILSALAGGLVGYLLKR